MSRNANTPGRRSLRLKGYDYSARGSYFVTFNVRNRECVLGEIRYGKMNLSIPGRIVDNCWLKLPEAFPGVLLDVYQIMPDHFHGIVVLWEDGGNFPCGNLINQIAPTNQIPTGHSPIPTGLNESRFGPVAGWQQMKNPEQTLGKIIRHFKAKAAKKIHDAGFMGFQWQSKYHDRIIRNEDELDRILLYIRNNPLNWQDDEENPADKSDS